VAQLLGPIHGVDGHHHRVGAQHPEVRDHELRAILQIEQHPVALAHAAALLQVPGEPHRVALELGEAPARAVEIDRGARRMARRRLGEVLEHVHLPDRELFRQAFGPVRVVAREHPQIA